MSCVGCVDRKNGHLSEVNIDSRKLSETNQLSHAAMKQWRHKQKIINWHAPKKAGALRSSYLANRTDGCENLSINDDTAADLCFCIYCDSWMCDNDGNSMWCTTSREDIFEFSDGMEKSVNRLYYLCEFNWENIKRKFIFSNPIILPLEIIEEANAALFNNRHAHKRIQEEDLASHYKYLKTSDPQSLSTVEFDPRDVQQIENTLGAEVKYNSIGGQGNINKKSEATFIALFLRYSIRSLYLFKNVSGNAQKDSANLAEYLFCKYPIPQWLKNVWINPTTSHSGELDQAIQSAYWFICLGQGGSLRKLAKLMGGRVSSRLVHFLYEAPFHLRPEMARAWAEAMRICGDRRVADWISQNPGYGIDSSSGLKKNHETRFREFWQQTVHWFARFQSELSDEEAAELLEWGNVRFQSGLEEFQNLQAREQVEWGSVQSGGDLKNVLFSWAGRTPSRALGVASRELQTFFRKLGGTTNFEWRPSKVNWNLQTSAFTGEGKDVWSFEELTQSSALWEEGVAMGHCVAGYETKCVERTSAIVSLRLNGMRVLTIELNRRNKAVVQVKGRFNREPTNVEAAVVEQWHHEVVLKDDVARYALAA